MKKYIAFEKSIKTVAYQLSIDKYTLEKERYPIVTIKEIVNKWLQQINIPATLHSKNYKFWLEPIVDMAKEYGVDYIQKDSSIYIQLYYFEPSYEFKETI